MTLVSIVTNTTNVSIDISGKYPALQCIKHNVGSSGLFLEHIVESYMFESYLI